MLINSKINRLNFEKEFLKYIDAYIDILFELRLPPRCLDKDYMADKVTY